MDSLYILMGLTGVGKSTAVAALFDAGVEMTLLPNRRQLTDEIIIPAVQKAQGEAPYPVNDRLQRFALTRTYRESHPSGMVSALQEHLKDTKYPANATLMFDNLRGLEEAKAATEHFPAARFILLDAPHETRLERLLGRDDSFDTITTGQTPHEDVRSALEALAGAKELFDLAKLAALTAHIDPDDILKAVKIIHSEAQNYDMPAAAAYLAPALPGAQFLHLDTARLPIDEVRQRIQAWL